MTVIEFECLNSIRYAMKLHLRWAWEIDILEWQDVHNAMSYLEDTLWAYLVDHAVHIEEQ